MITVRELINISKYFNFVVNGDDYDEDINHYADDWIVQCQSIDVHFNGYLSSIDPDEIQRPSYYLYISAEEPKND